MYIKIPVDFILRAARAQHGSAATLWENDGHAFRWNAKKNANDPHRQNIDLQAQTTAEYGADWRVVLTDFSKDGWAWFNPYAAEAHYSLCPVILVSNDQFGNVAGISQGCENFRVSVENVAKWYQAQVGKPLKVLPPHLFPSQLSAQQWLQIYQDQANRFDLWEYIGRELRRIYQNRMNANVIYVCAQYCGPGADWDYDAAGGGNWVSVSSNTTINRYDPAALTPKGRVTGYALAHEIGHTFGLGHTSTEGGRDATGIVSAVMQTAKPPEAILVPYEKALLRNNHPFFRG